MEDPLAADAAQHPQPADDVGGEVRQVAHHLALGQVAALQRLEQRPDQQQQHAARRSAPAGRAWSTSAAGSPRRRGTTRRLRSRGRSRPSRCRGGARSLVPIATTSPVATRLGSVAPRWVACRVTSCTVRYAAVSQLVTANRCRMMPEAGLQHADPEHDERPEQQCVGVARGDPVVDRLADHRGHDGLAGHPDDAEEHPHRQGAPLAPHQPPEVAAGRAMVGDAGIVEREVAHSSNGTEGSRFPRQSITGSGQVDAALHLAVTVALRSRHRDLDDLLA